MKAQYLSIAIGASLFAITGLAQANTTAATFSDINHSASFDGWNDLKRPLTKNDLLAGYGSNVVSSGDAVLTLVSGPYYPAGSGLYNGGDTTTSYLTFTDTSVINNLDSIVFQVQLGVYTIMPTVSLSYNGGTQNIAASLLSTNTDASYQSYTWDLAALTIPVTSYSVNFSIGGHSQALAFQVDQVASVSAVPEADSYAMMMLGLGVMGFVARRRNK